MAITEAAARGLGVVSRPAGALFDLPPGSYRRWQTIEEGRDALRWALENAQRLQAAARSGRYPTWTAVADALLEVMNG
jgi:hypothetical protein